jgi:hypothetical protein
MHAAALPAFGPTAPTARSGAARSIPALGWSPPRHRTSTAVPLAHPGREESAHAFAATSRTLRRPGSIRALLQRHNKGRRRSLSTGTSFRWIGDAARQATIKLSLRFALQCIPLWVVRIAKVIASVLHAPFESVVALLNAVFASPRHCSPPYFYASEPICRWFLNGPVRVLPGPQP